MSEGALSPAPEETPEGLRPKPPPSPEEGRGFQPPSNPHELKAQEARTARHLTYGLVSVLGASIVAQYLALAALIFWNRPEAIPNFEHLFNAWLPVIAGLASSAVTYYLTREKK